jgi:hypothetical protein
VAASADVDADGLRVNTDPGGGGLAGTEVAPIAAADLVEVADIAGEADGANVGSSTVGIGDTGTSVDGGRPPTPASAGVVGS